MSLSFIRTIVGAALLSVGLLAVLPARADDLAAIDPQARTGAAGWRVDGITGEASAHLGAAPGVPLAVGQVLSVGSDVETGAGAVVFLSRNGDRLIIQPNSHLRIDAPGTAGLLDHFMQSLGSVFYDVEPRKNRSFGVTAPYVAAVIKGTRFLVTVEPGRNSVRVSASGIPNTVPTQATDVPGPVETLASDGGAATGTSAVDGTTGAAGGVSSGAGKAVSGAVGATADAVAGAGTGVVGGVTDTVGGVVAGVTNTVGGVVGGIGGGLGGLLGGKN